jgi:hypothetical protein
MVTTRKGLRTFATDGRAHNSAVLGGRRSVKTWLLAGGAHTGQSVALRSRAGRSSGLG